MYYLNTLLILILIVMLSAFHMYTSIYVGNDFITHNFRKPILFVGIKHVDLG